MNSEDKKWRESEPDLYIPEVNETIEGIFLGLVATEDLQGMERHCADIQTSNDLLRIPAGYKLYKKLTPVAVGSVVKIVRQEDTPLDEGKTLKNFRVFVHNKE